MKKNCERGILSVCLYLVVAGCASSCQDYTFYDDNDALIKTMSYEAHFRKSFGEIDPNQNWGFDLMPLCGEGTRGANTESNIWESAYHFQVPGGLETETGKPWGWTPGDVSNYERAYVYWWFSTHQWPQTKQVDYHEYFMQNVWGQPEHSGIYADGSAYEVGQRPSMGMDNMHILLKDKTPISPNPIDNPIKDEETALNFDAPMDIIGDINRHDHINDFNAGGSGSKEQIMYVFDVCTLDFSYNESFNHKSHNNWTIQEINGNYYLAFDYWHKKDNQTEDYSYSAPDGYYNDWILKLYAAKPTNTSDPQNARRIMCEDLGNTYDWDFNDVVFDVLPYWGPGGKPYAWITLQAAGGTMPIWVGVDPTEHPEMELHKLFGVETNQPVNVNSSVGKDDLKPITYRIELTVDMMINGQLDPNKIPIYVPKRNNVTEDDKGTASNVMVLEAEQGKVPQKFACPTTTHWLKEEKRIEKAYDNFWNWVADATIPESDIWHHATSFEANYYPKSVVTANVDVDYFGDGEEPSQENVQPWKTLWASMVAEGGLSKSDYTATRTIQLHTGQSGAGDYVTTFIDNAPYIYEDVNGDTDNDPKAISANKMAEVISGNFVNQKVVWPNTHTVTITAVDETIGKTSGAGSYVHNRFAYLKAWAIGNGYVFAGWTDGEQKAERKVLVTNDIEFTPLFIQPIYLKEITEGFNGAGSELSLVTDEELEKLQTKEDVYVMVYSSIDWGVGAQIAYATDGNENYRSDIITAGGTAYPTIAYQERLAGADLTQLKLMCYSMPNISRVVIYYTEKEDTNQ